MPHTVLQWLAFLGVVAGGVFVSNLVMWVFMHWLLNPAKVADQALKDAGIPEAAWSEEKRKQLGVQKQTWVGSMEIILYSTAIVYGRPEFIAVWFATKYIAIWRGWSEDPVGRTLYNRSLFGSGLSILMGVATGGVAQWAIRAVQ